VVAEEAGVRIRSAAAEEVWHACACDTVTTMEEGADSSGIDGGRVERTRDRDLESFRTKNKTTQDKLLFIGSKLLTSVFKLQSLLIVLELIRSNSSLKSLLMKVLSVTIKILNYC
jgi:hypothetical protein